MAWTRVLQLFLTYPKKEHVAALLILHQAYRNRRHADISAPIHLPQLQSRTSHPSTIFIVASQAETLVVLQVQECRALLQACRAPLQEGVHQACRALLQGGVSPNQKLTVILLPDQRPRLQRRRLAKTRVAPQAETFVVLQAETLVVL